jgi:Kef-type K+ transport system membrane component KefB
MTPLLSLLLLIIFSYLGALFYKKIHIGGGARWIKGLTYTGSLYLLLGYIIGPEVFSIITPEISKKIEVIYTLALGWVGFLIGLQTNIRSLKRFQLKYYLYSSTLFFTALLLLQLFLIVAFYLMDYPASHLELLILSTAGAVTSPTMIAVFLQENRISGVTSQMLRFIPAFDNILGVVVLGLLMAFGGKILFAEQYDASFFTVFIIIGISTGIAFLYSRIIKKAGSDQERTLYIFGFIFLTIGFAVYLHQSILFAAFIFGFALSNFDKNKKELYLTIQNLEKHLYILLMIFAGINLSLKLSYLPILIIFTVFHILAKYFAGLSGNYLFRRQIKTNDKIGLGSLAMGGLSLAIVLDYHLKDLSDLPHLLLFVTTLAIILNDIISFNALGKYFAKKGADR